MAIFGQFTKRAQQVLMTAQECATREGQPYVGTLHFLYGLLDVGEAPESVTRHIQKEDVKQVLDQIDDEVSLHPGHGPVQMTPRARRVLDGSIIESRRLGQLYVGTEHMWLGILANPNCKAAELLAHRGVDASEAREELLARIRVGLKKRRSSAAETPAPASNVLRAGGLVLEPSSYTVTMNNQPINLTKKEFDLLKYLMSHKGEAVTRDALLTDVWGYDYAGDTNVVDVYIRYLRHKIDEPFGVKTLHTIRAVGYMFRVDD